MWNNNNFNQAAGPRRWMLIMFSIALGILVGRLCGSCFVRLADYDVVRSHHTQFIFWLQQQQMTNLKTSHHRRRRLGEMMVERAGGRADNKKVRPSPQNTANQQSVGNKNNVGNNKEAQQQQQEQQQQKQQTPKFKKNNKNEQQQTTPTTTSTTSSNILPKEKPLLWIHLGMPTTGLETFQDSLFHYRNNLQELGWDLYLPNPNHARSANCVAIQMLHPPSNNKNKKKWVPYYCKDKSEDGYKIQLKEQLSTIYKDTNLIFTGERFSNLDDDNHDGLNEFLQIVERTHRIRISIVYREKESMFAQFYISVFEKDPHLTDTSLPILIKNRPNLMFVNHTLNGWDKSNGIGDHSISIYSFEELEHRKMDFFQLFVTERICSNPNQATFLKGYRSKKLMSSTNKDNKNNDNLRVAIWKASKGFAMRSIAFEMGLTKEEVEACVNFEKANGIYGSFAKKCYHHNQLWDSWMEEEIEYMGGSRDDGNHHFNLRHLPLKLYPSHGGTRAVSEWCEVDREHETKYDVGRLQEAIRSAASGLCLDKLMIDE